MLLCFTPPQSAAARGVWQAGLPQRSGKAGAARWHRYHPPETLSCERCRCRRRPCLSAAARWRCGRLCSSSLASQVRLRASWPAHGWRRFTPCSGATWRRRKWTTASTRSCKGTPQRSQRWRAPASAPPATLARRTQAASRPSTARAHTPSKTSAPQCASVATRAASARAAAPSCIATARTATRLLAQVRRHRSSTSTSLPRQAVHVASCRRRLCQKNTCCRRTRAMSSRLRWG